MLKNRYKLSHSTEVAKINQPFDFFLELAYKVIK